MSAEVELMSAEENSFEEMVDRGIQASDAIRYGDVKYKNHEEAQKRNEMREDLLDRLDNSAAGEVQEYFSEVDELFEGAKYDGESDSGPSAFMLFVDDDADVVVNDEDYAKPLNTPDWSSYDWSDGGVPDFDHEESNQIAHDVMNDKDGSMAIDKNANIYEDTVKILDSDLPNEEYPEVGGTKHEAAVDAVYNELVNDEGEEVYVEALVLSGKTGDVRHFQPADPESDKKYNITEFPYDGEAQPRIPDNWREVAGTLEGSENDNMYQASL